MIGLIPSEDFLLRCAPVGSTAVICVLEADDVVDIDEVTGFVGDKLVEVIVRDENGDVILLPHLGASTKEAEINCANMACEQVSNFLKNGTIVNSVNFPSIRLGRTTNFRLIIINKNEPGMIGKIADQIASSNLNITDMTNKSRDEIAINLIDLDENPSTEIIENIKKIEHVLSVRLCK